MAASPIRGGLLLSSVDGPVPNGDEQIGLGVTTMHQLGAHLGSIVDVTVASPSGGERTVPFRVVSRISFPVLGGVVGLGRGAALTIAGYEAAVCPAGPKRPACLRALQSGPVGGGLLASVVAGPQGQAAVNYYLRTYRSITALPITPTSLVNFGEAVNFPLIFGGVLALSGAATLVHLLVVSVSRRRREIGLLKALGFVNRQIVASVAWQATALVAVGIVVGVPLGIVLGREVWSAFANNLGVVPVVGGTALAPGGDRAGDPRGGQLAGRSTGACGKTVQTTTASASSVSHCGGSAEIPNRPAGSSRPGWPVSDGPISPVAVSFAAGTVETELPVDYFFRHLRERAVVAEGISPQPDQSVAHAYPELSGDHSGGLVHDVVEIGAGSHFGGELAGRRVGLHDEDRLSGDVRHDEGIGVLVVAEGPARSRQRLRAPRRTDPTWSGKPKMAPTPPATAAGANASQRGVSG